MLAYFSTPDRVQGAASGLHKIKHTWLLISLSFWAGTSPGARLLVFQQYRASYAAHTHITLSPSLLPNPHIPASAPPSLTFPGATKTPHLNHFPSVNPSFLICKMGIIPASTSQGSPEIKADKPLKYLA